MSDEQLEDGEIASEHEPSPEAPDLNDEVLIDQIVQNENESAQRIKSPEVPARRRSNRNERRAAMNRQRNFSVPQPQMMGTSWHTNGNNSGGGPSGGGQRMLLRQPPSESVIFGIPSGPPPTLQQPPQSLVPSQDIARLQNLVHQSRDFYPPPPGIIPRMPFHYFPAPSDPQPLMAMTIQRPLMRPQPLPPAPPPPPQPSRRLQLISPTPIAAYRNDNYEDVSMELASPEEPQNITNNPFTSPPPVQIPLEAVTKVDKKSHTAPASPAAPSKSTGVTDDEHSLRALLLSQISQRNKRVSEKTVEKTPKRSRRSSTRLSSSVEDVFGAHKPISAPPPVPRIEVNIGTPKKVVTEPVEVAPADPIAPVTLVPVAPETPVVPVAPVVLVAPVEIPMAPATAAPSPVEPKEPQLTREEKRVHLEQKMTEINIHFEEQRGKVAKAAKSAKVASAMAARAEELAKQAEEMNREAMEMRQKCIEDSRTGKEEMKRLLVEKRETQNTIDMMSIEDMDEIDVDEFPEVFFETVRRDSSRGLDVVKNPKEEIDSPQFQAPESATKQPEKTVDSVDPNKESSRSQGGEEQLIRENVVENGVVLENQENGVKDIEVDHRDNEEVEDEEVEGEDEYEDEEEPVDVTFSTQNSSAKPTPTTSTETSTIEEAAVKEVLTNGVSSASTSKEDMLEKMLRARLLDKFARSDKSPENRVSSSIPDRAEECRSVVLKMCKFELNGKCERPRDCTFLHLHSINEHKQQAQLLEGLFRDVFQYQEADIEPAVTQTLHFLPQFREFEKLMDQFFKVVIHKTPDYKHRLFTFFAQRR